MADTVKGQKSQAIIDRMARAIVLADLFADEDIGVADRVLDDARRLLMYQAMSGDRVEVATAWARPDARAVNLAALLKGMMLADALGIIDWIRIVLWGAAFRNVTGSNFAEHMAQHFENKAGPNTDELN